MKNREKYNEELAKFASRSAGFAVVDNELKYCSNTACDKCLFGDDTTHCCEDLREQWCEQEYVGEPSIPYDTPEGTIVEVKTEYCDWCLRRFKKVEYNNNRKMFEYTVVGSGFSDEKEHGLAKFDYCRIAE